MVIIMEEKIKEIIEELRPFLINDGGDIEFVKLEDNIVYICIYEKENDKVYTFNIKVAKQSRKENKEEVIKLVKEKLLEII